MERPDYLSEHWFRYGAGIALAAPIPAHVRDEAARSSPNLWERVVHVFARAQQGDFDRAEDLLDVIQNGKEMHLTHSATRVFALTASSSALPKLARVFDHPDVDTRNEAYSVAELTGDLRLAAALAERRSRAEDWRDRERIEDSVSVVVEPWSDDPELMESKLDNDAFRLRVQEIVAGLEARHGKGIVMLGGEPLDARKLVSKIAALAGEEDEEQLFLNGAPISDLFDILEGLTGIPCAGCLDHPIKVDLAKVTRALDTVNASGIIDRLEPGHRYFFGRRIP